VTAPATALLTFRIGPVHTFIAQARRVADLWTGSEVLSRLIEEAIRVLLAEPGCQMVFPFIAPPAAGQEPELPAGLPNRFVARVPTVRGEEIARRMRTAVEARWNALVRAAVEVIEGYGFTIATDIWSEPPSSEQPRQPDHVLEIAWSLVEERGDYAAASLDGARRFAASRRFRPFATIEERGEKCAVCGERTALPDGIRQTVRDAWVRAEELSKKSRSGDRAFFRLDQTRLCLVCATKRLYPKVADCPDAWFSDFRHFEPRENETDENFHYFALLKVDGDRLGKVLSRGPEEVRDERVEELHRDVSSALARFADALRSGTPNLNLIPLGGYAPAGKAPQLIYAGGDDVLVVCDPRDALPLALRLRASYEKELVPLRDLLVGAGAEEAFTVSGAVLFAHTKHPAGLLFNDLENLLKRKAKQEMGRNALAMRLDKRGGVPVEVAFAWDDIVDFTDLVGLLSDGELSSKLTYHLREDEDVVAAAFTQDKQRWEDWLADRIGRGGTREAVARRMAALMVPIFLSGRSQALRIARFLATEVRERPAVVPPAGTAVEAAL